VRLESVHPTQAQRARMNPTGLSFSEMKEIVAAEDMYLGG
jgi:hypothetical protein